MSGSRASELRRLHRPGSPVVLPNVWDAASARAVVDAGFPAVATGSGAVAAALGYPDGEGTPAAEMFAAIERVANAVDVPVTADIEAGYGLAADELATRLLDAGAAGCNLEDSDPRSKRLVDVEQQAGRLAALRAAAGDALVINARIDVHLRGVGSAEQQRTEAVERGNRYLSAGADCVYPITVADDELIGELVSAIDGPVNVLYRPGTPSFARLAELGVARVSFGGGLHTAAMGLLTRMLGRIAEGADPYSRG